MADWRLLLREPPCWDSSDAVRTWLEARRAIVCARRAGVDVDAALQRILTRSPACRQEGESEKDCVERKIPEILGEMDVSQDEAVAIAYSMCGKPCSEKAERPPSEVRAPIFDRDKFTRGEATQWAQDHDFKSSNVEETEDSWRLRQRPPGDFQEDSFRTIELADGVKAVIGRLKEGKSMPAATKKRPRRTRRLGPAELIARIKSHQPHRIFRNTAGQEYVAGLDEVITATRNSVAGTRKTVLTRDQVRALMKRRGLVYKAGDERRVIDYTASTERVDHHGDIIRLGGWDFSVFQRNPLLLLNHAYDGLPIGKALEWAVEPMPARKDRDSGPERRRLRISVLFMDEKTSPEAHGVFKMVDGGWLLGSSVGFIPREVEELSAKERERLGMDEWGNVFSRQALLELSVATIPANPDALAEATKFVAAVDGALTDGSLTVREIEPLVHAVYRRSRSRLIAGLIGDLTRKAFLIEVEQGWSFRVRDPELFADPENVGELRQWATDEEGRSIWALQGVLAAETEEPEDEPEAEPPEDSTPEEDMPEEEGLEGKPGEDKPDGEDPDEEDKEGESDEEEPDDEEKQQGELAVQSIRFFVEDGWDLEGVEAYVSANEADLMAAEPVVDEEEPAPDDEAPEGDDEPDETPDEGDGSNEPGARGVRAGRGEVVVVTGRAATVRLRLEVAGAEVRGLVHRLESEVRELAEELREVRGSARRRSADLREPEVDRPELEDGDELYGTLVDVRELTRNVSARVKKGRDNGR